ncbi:hypothetical protein Q1695_002591 [Nippostrongylus brasiliensis]|nr:hypothetical protein Q1695_002591 [Nippostrongylus brasiliensis]
MASEPTEMANEDRQIKNGVESSNVNLKQKEVRIDYDGSALMMRYDGEYMMPVDVLKELVRKGVRYEAAHSWDDVVMGKKE